MGTYTAHIDRQSEYIIDILDEEVEAFINKPTHPKIITRDQNWNSISNFKIGFPPFVSRHSFVAISLFSDNIVEFDCVIICGFLLLFFYVVEEPLEDQDVSVHTDVYVICAFRRFQMLFKVLHVF